MKMCMVLSILFVSCFFRSGSVCDGHLIVNPDNAAAVIDSNITLRCSRNNAKVLWYFGGGTGTLVFNGYGVNASFPRHSVPGRPQNYDVFVTSVQLDDAGTYRCGTTHSSQATAEVVVLEKEVECMAHQSDRFLIADVDNLTADCSLNYSGNWAPQLYWEQISGSQTSPVESQPCLQHRQTRTKTVCVGLLKIVRADMRDVIYRCTGRFTLTDKPSQTTAQNNINWTSSCLSSKLNVAYGPKSTKIESLSNDTSQLRCTSDSNPPAEYVWFHVDGDVYYKRQEIDLCQLADDGLTTLVCEASNAATNLKEATAISFNDTAWKKLINMCQKESSTNRSGSAGNDNRSTPVVPLPLYTYITWAVVAVVLIAVIISCIWIRFKCVRHSGENKRPGARTATPVEPTVPGVDNQPGDDLGYDLAVDSQLEYDDAMNTAHVYDEIDETEVVELSTVETSLEPETEMETSYNRLDSATREPPPVPTVYQGLPHHPYIDVLS